jgi:uncharacterized protein (DUF2062 family)
MSRTLRKPATVFRRRARNGWFHLRRQTPGKDDILAQPWLQPVRPYLSDDRLWALERQSVARGVAVGLFMGLLMPVAQILFAVAGAAAIKGHVPISAACTLVTNPFTVPPIYYAAYCLGDRLLPASLDLSRLTLDANNWLANGLNWVIAHGAPLMTGLLVIAAASAVLGYLAVHACWRNKATSPR